LDVVVDGEPITASADAQQGFQMLANARRHATGRIDVLVARVTVGAVVTVADNGPGIAAVDRERIFDRLVRLDAARAESNGQSGAGLGPAIARGLRPSHGGDMCCVTPAMGGQRSSVPPSATQLRTATPRCGQSS
jgi:signal transduction histidine kinase